MFDTILLYIGLSVLLIIRNIQLRVTPIFYSLDYWRECNRISMSKPNIIRYQANTLNVCFSTNLTMAFTTSKAAMNAVTKPTEIFNKFSEVKTSTLRNMSK